MVQILVRHKVQDFDTWKVAFDGHGAMRKAAGGLGGIVFRNASDPHEVVSLLSWESLEKAQQFAGSDSLREAMQNAGVTDRPDVYFLNEADRTAQ